MSRVVGRLVSTTAGLIAVALIPGCGIISKTPAPKESSHTLRDQCNRTLDFFANDLGVADVGIEYGSDKPEAPIARGATCTITQSSLVGIGQTRLRAMLPSETDPPLVKGDTNYIPQSGYEEKVWVKHADDAVSIATEVAGWQSTFSINAALINVRNRQPRFKISDHQIHNATQFLIDLTKELGS